MVSQSCFDLHFLITKEVEHDLNCLLTIRSCSVENTLFSSVPHFLNGLIRVLVFSPLSSLYILEIRPLFDEGLVNIFSQSVGCLFVLVTVSFALQKLLTFRRSHLFIVALIVSATGQYIESLLLRACVVDYFQLSLLSGSVWPDLY